MSSAMLALRVYAVPVQTVTAASITSSFVATGAAMPAPIRILKISNTTNADIYVSYDGSTIHDAIPSSSGMVLDFTANKTLPNGNFLSEGTIVYIKYVILPTTGNVYVSAYYSSNQVE